MKMAPVCNHLDAKSGWVCSDMFMAINVLKNGICPFLPHEQHPCCKYTPIVPRHYNPNRIPRKT